MLCDMHKDNTTAINEYLWEIARLWISVDARIMEVIRKILLDILFYSGYFIIF